MIDAASTATVLDMARDRRLFVPILLASLCGLRRGEIAALRWSAVDLDRGQLAVVASTEQRDDGSIREKDAKSGKSRTVALPAMAIEELRRWKSQQAEEPLCLGIFAEHVVTRADGVPLQPRSLTHVMSAFLKPRGRNAARIAPHRCKPATGLQHASEDRPGTPRTLLDRHHDGYLFPPDAEHAG